MDLDINHYTLMELLNLFKLPVQFNETELKAAKKVVLMTHPDKSKLPSEYFNFFSQAYRILTHVYRARTSERMSDDQVDEHSDDKKSAAMKFVQSPNFQKEFNSLFERSYVRPDEEAEGYGDWLKSQENLSDSYEERKRNARQLVVSPGVEPTGTSLRVSTVGSGKGGDYADLKHVYTVGSVVGVCEKADLPSNRSFEEIKFERSKKITPMSNQESERFLVEEAARKQEEDSHRAFNLIRHNLQQEQQSKGFWSHLLRLE
jgi:hypothetical protein